jgi:thioredoxin-related protein
VFSRLFTVLFIALPFFVFSSQIVADQPEKRGEVSATSSIEIRDAREFFDESFDDFQQELEVAKDEQKKGILLMYEMDECPFCARMKATVLNRSDIQDYFSENFRIMSVDTEGDLEMTDFMGKTTTQKDFALKNRVRATPVFQFYDLDGKPMKNGRLTGATKNAEEFMLFGRYIAQKQNEKQSFFQYRRKQNLAD